MALWVKALAAKSDDLRWTPDTRIVEGENGSRKLSSGLLLCLWAHVPYPYTYVKVKNKTKTIHQVLWCMPVGYAKEAKARQKSKVPCQAIPLEELRVNIDQNDQYMKCSKN